jgi:hypothetical protein
MKGNINNSFFLAALLSLVLVICELGHCSGEEPVIKMKLGGVHDCKGSQNSAEIDNLARFAVQEHNNKEVCLLSLPFNFLFSLVVCVVGFNGCSCMYWIRLNASFCGFLGWFLYLFYLFIYLFLFKFSSYFGLYRIWFPIFVLAKIA